MVSCVFCSIKFFSVGRLIQSSDYLTRVCFGLAWGHLVIQLYFEEIKYNFQYENKTGMLSFIGTMEVDYIKIRSVTTD